VHPPLEDQHLYRGEQHQQGEQHRRHGGGPSSIDPPTVATVKTAVTRAISPVSGEVTNRR
jgi:hypothetical protein